MRTSRGPQKNRISTVIIVHNISKLNKRGQFQISKRWHDIALKTSVKNLSLLLHPLLARKEAIVHPSNSNKKGNLHEKWKQMPRIVSK